MFKFLRRWLDRDGPEVVFGVIGIVLGAALLVGGIFELWIKAGESGY